MTVRAGDVLDDTKQLRCTSCGATVKVEGRHPAAACPHCNGEEFDEA